MSSGLKSRVSTIALITALGFAAVVATSNVSYAMPGHGGGLRMGGLPSGGGIMSGPPQDDGMGGPPQGGLPGGADMGGPLQGGGGDMSGPPDGGQNGGPPDGHVPNDSGQDKDHGWHKGELTHRPPPPPPPQNGGNNGQ